MFKFGWDNLQEHLFSGLILIFFFLPENLKKTNLEIVFYFHNKLISLIQAWQMELYIFFVIGPKRERNILKWVGPPSDFFFTYLFIYLF